MIWFIFKFKKISISNIREPKINLYSKPSGNNQKRDIIDSKNPRGSSRKMIPSSRGGSRRKIERNSSKKNLNRQPSSSYLDKYNSRNSRDKKRSSSRKSSYDNSIGFKKRKNSIKRDRSRSIGQSSKKSSSRSHRSIKKNEPKKLNPVRPPSRRKSIDRGSASKYNSGRRKSRERISSKYGQARVKSNRNVRANEK